MSVNGYHVAGEQEMSSGVLLDSRVMGPNGVFPKARRDDFE